MDLGWNFGLVGDGCGFSASLSKLGSTPGRTGTSLAESLVEGRSCEAAQQDEAGNEEASSVEQLLLILHIDSLVQPHGPEEPADDTEDGHKGQNPEQFLEHLKPPMCEIFLSEWGNYIKIFSRNQPIVNIRIYVTITKLFDYPACEEAQWAPTKL